MKKLWIVLILILVLIIVVLFLPGTRKIVLSRTLKTNSTGFIRCFSDERKWGRWWPGTASYNSKGLPVFSYNNNQYTIIDKSTNSFIINIDHGNHSFKTILNFIATSPDSMALSWAGRLQTPANPFERWNSSFKGDTLEKDMQFILSNLESFFSDEKNIYGREILQEKVTDSLLISAYKIIRHLPTAGDIYALIDELRDYARKNGALETGFPMLNVLTKDSLEYLTRLAIPVNRKLPNNGNITYKWMLGGGNILVSEVKGGPFQIRNAMNEMENYVNDHKRVAPAIPFESLVTDRRQETDTTKWITRIYYPVM